LYWTIGKDNFVQETTALNDGLPSIEHLFITRLQIGFRVYEFDEEASRFLKPILAGMRANRTPPEISTEVPPNKRAGTDFFVVVFRNRCFLEACERRGADLIERVAVVFQNIFDTLKVLKSIRPIDFRRIQRNTLDEVRTRVDQLFYPNRNSGYVIAIERHSAAIPESPLVQSLDSNATLFIRLAFTEERCFADFSQRSERKCDDQQQMRDRDGQNKDQQQKDIEATEWNAMQGVDVNVRDQGEGR
jgi:hypothetical protein